MQNTTKFNDTILNAGMGVSKGHENRDTKKLIFAF